VKWWLDLVVHVCRACLLLSVCLVKVVPDRQWALGLALMWLLGAITVRKLYNREVDRSAGTRQGPRHQ
jgi:hypothetical protein